MPGRLEIRFRTVRQPGAPTPFDPWFVAPGVRVHGTNIRFHGDEVESDYIASPGPSTSTGRLLDAMLACPAPNCHEWRLAERRDDGFTVHGRWREPLYPGVSSPMKVARDVLGPEVEYSWTMTEMEMVHRAFVPRDSPVDHLWPRLRDCVDEFCGFARSSIRVELERLGPTSPGGAVDFADSAAVLRAAFALGYYEQPPRASVQDVAVAAGVTGAEALRLLRRVEGDSLRGLS